MGMAVAGRRPMPLYKRASVGYGSLNASDDLPMTPKSTSERAPLIVALGLMLGALLACKGSAKEGKELATVMDELRSLPKKIAAPGTAAKPCDDAALAKHGASGERLWIDAFDLDALRGLPNKPSEDWLWLNGTGARKFLGADLERKGASEWDASKLRETGLIAVISSSERTLPEVHGDSYRGGVFKGALQIVNLPKGEVLCEAPLEVQSANEVEFRSRGLRGTTPERAVSEDFRDRAKQAGTRALRSISKVAFVSTTAGSWGE
jgi:hypothetical protein